MSDSNQPKVIPIQEVAADDDDVSLYAAHQKIYPRSVKGVFARWRWIMVWVTQIVFYGFPWLEWGQRQAVLFDLGARRFYIFGLVLYPQDFIYLTGLLVISAYSLFLFTAIAGRLWCGYACPQTVYTEIFIWIEKWVEGDRSARMRLDQSPWGLNKIARKVGKQVLWVSFSLWTGFTLVGYFTPIHALMGEVLTLSTGAWETFWIFFYGFATYGLAGFMREQVCKYMCPYARFQSAMFDKDTLIVTYDSERGEPRGARSKKADPKALGLGSCVDCSLCVQVCPTGIDIRKGLQYECIGCGACADVCDDVMDKLHYPKGLIRYSTENALTQHWGARDILRHVLRPRVLIYSSILGLIVLAMAVSLWLRSPFKVDIVRDRGALARIADGGNLENVFRLQVMNVTEQEQEYSFEVSDLPQGKVLLDYPQIVLAPTEARWVAVRVQIPYDALPAGSHTFHFVVTALGNQAKVVEKSVFIVPR